ncbi:MAG UNVERIFIED_CONTAM: hypothetical protein LVR18_17875 [Planctomycetaceae bacterium]|jgi:hypothetical protein
MDEQLPAYYGLPPKVQFCRRCVMSNQRPASAVEFRHTIDSRKKTLAIDGDGVCDACHVADHKQTIDWKAREESLLQLLDQYRSKDGSYDCIVPGSGGKDMRLSGSRAEVQIWHESADDHVAANSVHGIRL